jgi:hypothetical protein
MHREFGHKRLTYILEKEAPTLLERQIPEKSLYFPGYQGIWTAETRSPQPPSTATISN